MSKKLELLTEFLSWLEENDYAVCGWDDKAEEFWQVFDFEYDELIDQFIRAKRKDSDDENDCSLPV